MRRPTLQYWITTRAYSEMVSEMILALSNDGRDLYYATANERPIVQLSSNRPQPSKPWSSVHAESCIPLWPPCPKIILLP